MLQIFTRRDAIVAYLCFTEFHLNKHKNLIAAGYHQLTVALVLISEPTLKLAAIYYPSLYSHIFLLIFGSFISFLVEGRHHLRSKNSKNLQCVCDSFSNHETHVNFECTKEEWLYIN